jgi:hypothetical protein
LFKNLSYRPLDSDTLSSIAKKAAKTAGLSRLFSPMSSSERKPALKGRPKFKSRYAAAEVQFQKPP